MNRCLFWGIHCFFSILQGSSSKILKVKLKFNTCQKYRGNLSYAYLLYFWQELSFHLTFDPSCKLQFLNMNHVKLKRNLVSVPRKRNLFILKRFVLECTMPAILDFQLNFQHFPGFFFFCFCFCFFFYCVFNQRPIFSSILEVTP